MGSQPVSQNTHEQWRRPVRKKRIEEFVLTKSRHGPHPITESPDKIRVPSPRNDMFGRPFDAPAAGLRLDVSLSSEPTGPAVTATSKPVLWIEGSYTKSLAGNQATRVWFNSSRLLPSGGADASPVGPGASSCGVASTGVIGRCIGGRSNKLRSQSEVGFSTYL